jgi:hypothetical protein
MLLRFTATTSANVFKDGFQIKESLKMDLPSQEVGELAELAAGNSFL